MSDNRSKVENWWNDHPLLKNFYVPLVLTATFIVTIVDSISNARGK